MYCIMYFYGVESLLLAGVIWKTVILIVMLNVGKEGENQDCGTKYYAGLLFITRSHIFN